MTDIFKLCEETRMWVQ